MNHDAKQSGGIFRRRPSSSGSTSSRLSIQSGHSGSVSCPVSPRHTKHLPVVPSLSSVHFNEVLAASTSSYRDGTRIHRSPSASNTYNHRQQSSGNLYSYTGSIRCSSKTTNEVNLVTFVGPPSAPVSAHTSRVDLSNIGRPSTGSVIYLGRTNSSNTGSRLSLVSRSSSLSSPHSSPKHRPRQ